MDIGMGIRGTFHEPLQREHVGNNAYLMFYALMIYYYTMNTVHFGLLAYLSSFTNTALYRTSPFSSLSIASLIPSSVMGNVWQIGLISCWAAN